MPIFIRRSGDRGQTNYGWLSSLHSFSFGDYFDQRHMGFGPLRVINEDRVAPGAGFPSHGHRNMEIISYVVSGRLTHEDGLGNVCVLMPGDVQAMSAGSGVMHSENNRSDRETAHFLQIWIAPEAPGGASRYDQKSFPAAAKENRLRLLVSRDGREGSLTIRQDADVYAAVLGAFERVSFPLRPSRKIWVQLVRGRLQVNGVQAETGDGLAIASEDAVLIRSQAEESEFLLFDLP